MLRDGRNAGTLAREAIAHDRLVELMVGRAVASAPTRPSAPSGPAVLQVERLRTGRYPDVEVTLSAHGGEVLGIAGLTGAGRSELAEAICGVGVRLAGRVLLDGQPLAIAHPRRRDPARHLPGARGSSPLRRDRGDERARERDAAGARLVRPLRLCRARPRGQAVRAVTTALAVKAASTEVPVATLSGGNQQKVVLGKWLALRPRVIVFDEPTQGVDVRAKAEIHRLIRGLADEGAAVILISSDMEEIVAESDRVAVMHDGRITGILPRADCTPESIMRLAVA